MQIGAMNNPNSDLCGELEWIGRHRFDFVDLTVEPDRCMPEDIDVRAVRRRLQAHGLGVLQH